MFPGSYQPELVPTLLLLTMAAAVEGSPFPAVVEAILMVVIFELLREGGIRLPAVIGPALSIVGALIIGDAAVKAGLIGAPIVIVIAITAVSSFFSGISYRCGYPVAVWTGYYSRNSWNIRVRGRDYRYTVSSLFPALFWHPVFITGYSDYLAEFERFIYSCPVKISCNPQTRNSRT